MAKLIEIIINGIALGSVYALIALGFVIIFKVSGVFNFAHGSLLLFGGYIIATLHDDLGFAAAVAIAVVATAALAGAIEVFLLRGLAGAQVAALTILTIGVDILVLTELGRRIGGDVLNLGDPWGAAVTSLDDIFIADARIASIVVSLVLIGVFFAVFRWSRWGLAMRAAAADREAAALMGVRLDRVQLAAWCIAGILAAVAAVFLAAFPSAGLDRTTGQIALKAFPAAVLGGMDSTNGALLGSMIIGLTEALAAGYQGQLAFLGGGIGDVAPYAVMLLVLLVAVGLIGAAAALMFLGRSQAESYVLALLAVLGMVGVFSLFAAAAGILRVATRSEGNPAFKRVLDDAFDGVAVTDDSGRVVYANAAYCQLVDAPDQSDVPSRTFIQRFSLGCDPLQ